VGGDFGNGFTPQHRDQASLFSEINASVGSAVSLLGGARLEWYEGLGWVAVPRASARVSLVPDRLSLRAAIGRGFKAPNIEQQFTSNAFIVPNRNLKPETSWSAELGTDVTLANGLRLSATYFQQRFYDLIRVVAAPAPETRYISQNLGRSDANGVEIEAGWTLPNGVTATGNVSWIHTSIVDNAGLAPSQFPVGAALPSSPFFIGGGALDVPLGRVHAVVRTTIVGRDIVLSEIFSGSRNTLDPYALFGLTLTGDVASGITLFARGDNLLNTYYPAGFDRRGISRTWTVGLRLTN
jgi:outer membrane receptor protein involved in Fe transport